MYLAQALRLSAGSGELERHDRRDQTVLVGYDLEGRQALMRIGVSSHDVGDVETPGCDVGDVAWESERALCPDGLGSQMPPVYEFICAEH